ncbi:PREDICTED: N-acetyl-beta-glucosaminyl-glycoprotein 4-beta-N-acetylgalactosaminyltransferase 1 [Dipodomys ordii]|uniref:Hexosyltransferase n=1 Tax=Dipodomys ordii TaxID=10020 RepID=A0A1S3GKM8_DIPOR|nr:PREDICTED: N-acetyl-beta-glucosaminyl-glycoprotein 4-beta-N-acetylgalactosaminyltransferase 1 [Dipodomys ordii]
MLAVPAVTFESHSSHMGKALGAPRRLESFLRQATQREGQDGHPATADTHRALLRPGSRSSSSTLLPRCSCAGQAHRAPADTHSEGSESSRLPPTDGEKLPSVTDGHGAQALPTTQRADDSSESREEEQASEGRDPNMLFPGGAGRPPPLNLTHQTPPWREELPLTAPRMEPSSLENVLEPCAYAPTYILKDFPIARYQGLQFVYLSFVYPNDYTRLTHMESDNKCFYRESPLYLERFGFYKYMKMDREEGEDDEEEMQRRAFLFLNPDDFLDDEDDRELLDSLEPTGASVPQLGRQTPTLVAPTKPKMLTVATPVPPTSSSLDGQAPRHSRALSWASRPLPLFLGRAPPPHTAPSKVYVTRVRPVQPRLRASRRALPDAPWPPFPRVFPRPRPLPRVQLRAPPRRPQPHRRRTAEPRPSARTQAPWGSRVVPVRARELEAPTADTNSSAETKPVTSFLRVAQVSRPQLPGEGEEEGEEGEDDGLPGEEATPDGSEEEEEAAARPAGRWREDAIDWQRTFSVGTVDFELLRSDWNDLRCNVSGNLQLPEAEAVDVAAQYMERLNARHGGYQYLRRTGNFERSAGLQAGVDAVEDPSSIVFLCDLHIYFPLNILDSIRKHCVEGKLAFAPVVMRLGCGSSPGNPHGYWEVNGFGLFGIYKSDFDRVGGMNTEEFRDQWGGEDWELLDRVLQAGLEVERLRLRNFYHHYHSKRGMWGTRSRKGSRVERS